jgi:two-component system chemotaxis response regulator CheB/chemosensory pili system protein ChpB (putative protein-glutamate methylesterase)
MNDRRAAVALLFDDSDLGGQLREALSELGARIVYDAGLASFDRDALVAAAADVIVIDLDDPSDDDLDRLYAAVDGDRPRLVFNDADVSKGLAGWDKARWARHLASKVLVGFDIDPPRPEGARAIEPHTPAGVDTVSLALVTDEVFVGHADEVALLDDLELEMSLAEAKDNETDTDPRALEAELEALLSAGDEPVADAAFDTAIGGDAAFTLHTAFEPLADDVTHADEHASAAVVPPAFDFSRFELASMDDDAEAGNDVDVANVLTIEARATEIVLPPPPEWDLIDGDAVAVEAPAPATSNLFGIETISAAEFLNPHVEDDGSLDIQTGIGLELVSIEEAIAPPTDGEFHSEMFLEGHHGAIRRLVLLGAARDSGTSVHRFIGALSSGLNALVLLVQHLDDDDAADVLASSLASAGGLPVSVAADGKRATQGSILLIPRGRHISLRRDGLISLRDDDAAAQSRSPSIDAAFSTAAHAFGADALAIVFAGHANDAVAGAQAIHDRGGRVWIEEPDDHNAAQMVAGIREERIVSFSGSVEALAGRLSEEFS